MCEQPENYGAVHQDETDGVFRRGLWRKRKVGTQSLEILAVTPIEPAVSMGMNQNFTIPFFLNFRNFLTENECGKNSAASVEFILSV